MAYLLLREKYKFFIDNIKEVNNELHLEGTCREIYNHRIVTIVLKKNQAYKIIDNSKQ